MFAFVCSLCSIIELDRCDVRCGVRCDVLTDGLTDNDSVTCFHVPPPRQGIDARATRSMLDAKESSSLSPVL